MTHAITKVRLTRRRFAFWVGLGLFNLSEVLGTDALDRVAAASMRATERTPDASGDSAEAKVLPEHWTASENNTWRWFERENLIDDRWKLTGITTPIHKRTGQRHDGSGYLDDSLVPESMRHGDVLESGEKENVAVEEDAGKVNPMRRARHGRPPSRWLRSLNADELRIWLKKIDVPEAGVSGMTFWDHLTRDHSFNAKRITGLTVDEQAKLHAAAHFGY